jgi:hypothetical protein
MKTTWAGKSAHSSQYRCPTLVTSTAQEKSGTGNVQIEVPHLELVDGETAETSLARLGAQRPGMNKNRHVSPTRSCAKCLVLFGGFAHHGLPYGGLSSVHFQL